MRQLRTELVDMDSLKPYRGNARTGDVSAIRESLRVNDLYRPLVVRKQNREILAGNHTWQAAKEEGFTQIWVTFISCTVPEGRRINLADNRTAELGGYNEEALLQLLGALPSLEGTGWKGSDLESLKAKLGPDPLGDGVGDGQGQEPDTDYGVMVVCSGYRQQQEVQAWLEVAIMEGGVFAGVEIKAVEV